MPQSSLPKASRRLKQCQHCFKSDSNDAPLLICSKCKRAHYCSRECQIKDWKNHKALCTANSQTRAAMKADDDLINDVLAKTGITIANGETKVKKWVQFYKPLLTATLAHALRLKETPEACSTHLLLFTLTPKFTAANPPVKDKDIWTAFRVTDVHVLSFEECVEAAPILKGQIDNITAISTNAKRETPNAMVGFTFISIPSLHTVRLVPLGINCSAEDLEPWDPQWEEKFKIVTERGFL